MEQDIRRNFPGQNIKDMKGQTVPFVFNNGITWGGSDYCFNVGYQPEGFFLIPLGAGAINVQLFGQKDNESYLISAAEITAYTGMPLPYRVKKVIATSTTVSGIKIVW